MKDLGAAAKLRAIFELSPTILAVTDLADGRIIEVNEAFLRATGYTREEITGRTIPDLGLWKNPDMRLQGIAALRAGHAVRDLEAHFRTKGGGEIVAIAAADLVVVEGSTCILTSLMDITERKQLEAERDARRMEAERESRAKDEFLAMLGHELRNPLGTITNTLSVLNRLLSDDELRRLTAIIGRQATHLSRLVDDLLDVARLTSGKIDLRLATTDLRELATRCVDSLTDAGRTAAHRIVVEGDSVSVKGDPARLEQVISNLLDNALKYTPAGGEVRIITTRVGGDAVVHVQDTGEGIRPDLLPKVFDLFAQEPQALDRARGGLGLGLTLVKRLVELHGGSVSAASEGRGRGSHFTVRLPAAAAVAARETVATPLVDADANGRRRRVLIVEDNADARDSLSLFLQLAGHDVDTSEDGARALDKLLTFRPDVAVIDVGLPGMDGYEVARAIRQRPGGGGIRLIALTGYGQAEDQRRALAAGFDIHLTKPIDPAKIQDLLATR
jgi:PAS domain S-box-containing protein